MIRLFYRKGSADSRWKAALLCVNWDKDCRGVAVLPVSLTEGMESPALLSVWWTKRWNSFPETFNIHLFWKRLWKKRLAA